MNYVSVLSINSKI